MDSIFTADSNGGKILNFIESLTKKLLDENQAVASYAKNIGNYANRMAEVISSQQKYASGAAGMQNCSAPTIIDDALISEEDMLKKQSVLIIKNYSSIQNIRVKKHKLLNVFISLIRNAVDAMEDAEEKEIQIQTGLDARDDVYIKFRDSGKGIDEKDLPHIFKHGFTTKYGSHGFGLHSCANTMQELGGSISIDNNENKGTTVTMIFPTKS